MEARQPLSALSHALPHPMWHDGCDRKGSFVLTDVLGLRWGMSGSRGTNDVSRPLSLLPTVVALSSGRLSLCGRNEGYREPGSHHLQRVILEKGLGPLYLGLQTKY